MASVQQIQVQVPPGAVPGQQVQCEFNGNTYMVQIPAGVAAGGVFLASIPVKSKEEPVAAYNPTISVAPSPNEMSRSNMSGQMQQTLDQLTGFDIVQQFHGIEVVGWEKNNEYHVHELAPSFNGVRANQLGNYLILAKEKADCFERQCCGPRRSSQINFYSSATQEVLAQWNKSFHLSCCCFFRPNSMMVSNGAKIGTIHDPCHVLELNQVVRDANENPRFYISGSVCQIGSCCPCTDFNFTIKDASSGQVIGAITKKFNGVGELCVQVNRFQVEFPKELTAEEKLNLLGAAFLLDFEYFERK